MHSMKRSSRMNLSRELYLIRGFDMKFCTQYDSYYLVNSWIVTYLFLCFSPFRLMTRTQLQHIFNYYLLTSSQLLGWLLSVSKPADLG